MLCMYQCKTSADGHIAHSTKCSVQLNTSSVAGMNARVLLELRRL
jgi:hypothetical protein